MRKRRLQRIPTLNMVILATIVSVAVIFTLMILFVANFLFTQSKDNAKAENINNANQISISLRDNLDYMSRLLHLTKQSFAEINFQPGTETTVASIDNILMSMLDLNPDVHSAWSIFEKGEYYKDKLYTREYVRENGAILKSHSLNAEEISEHPDSAPWYYEPLTTGDTYFTVAELYKYSDDNELVYAATLSMPIFENGKITGVCGIDILYSDIMDMIYNLNQKQNRDIMLLNRDMTILHAYDNALINKNLADFTFKDNDLDNLRGAMERGEIYSNEIISPISNEEVFVYLQPISVRVGAYQQPLYLHIGTPLSQLNAEAYGIILMISIAGIFSMLLITGAVFLNANRLVKPIKNLARRSQQVASGDFSDDIFDVSDYRLNTKSEIDNLQRAFNEMLRALQNNLHTVEKRVEERTRNLNKLNSYIALLLENTSNVSMLTDKNLNVLYCSNSYMKLMCLTDMLKIIGKPISEIHRGFTKEEYLAHFKKRLTRMLSGEIQVVEDDAVIWPSDETRLYRIVYRQVKDDDGNFDGVAIIMCDLTDVRIEESEHRVNDMLQSTLIPCFVWDEAGNIVAYNKPSAAMFGISDDLPHERFNELYFSSIQPEFQPDGTKTETVRIKLLHEALDNGFAQFIGRLAKSDGTPIFVSVTVARIAWLSGYRLIVYHHDTTELMEKEEEAKKANKRLQLMLDSAPLGTYYLTKDSICLECNQEAVNMFGLSSKQEFCERYAEFSPEYQPGGRLSTELRLEIIGRAFQEDCGNFEWMHQKLNGELIPCEVTIIRTQYQEDDVIMVYTRDLSEIRAKEQQMKEISEKEREAEIQLKAAQVANETKSQFLANMSHEIRTPMNAVLGMSELLLQENLNKRQYRYADDIKTSAMALLGIINDILDVSKIQAGKFTLIPVHYDFNMLIDNIGSIAQFMVQNKNVVFRLSIQENGPICLYGDNIRLRQVLLNLLSNAIKFTDKGYVQLTICFTDTTVKITVNDTGVGIPAKSIPTLFDAFEQADVEKHRDKTGTGLGLTITKSIIDMMEGNITVESEYGSGTSFHVEIPKIPGDEKLIQYSEDTDVIVYAPDAKILVVDDNKTNLNVACGLLQLCGISAETAESGAEAVELVRQRQYDIVFMDHRMPGMSGTETTKVIRGLGIDVHIIALTASSVYGVKEKMLDSGMNDFLWKPIKKTELMQILKKWIPAEKQLIPPDQQPKTDAIDENEDDGYTEFWDRIEQIKEISISEGLGRVDRQWGVYEKSLKLMIREINKSEKNLPVFLSADDMENFRIEVHGIKGALANIGAMKLSAKAYDFEMASDKMDSVFCVLNLPDFLKDLNGLNKQLKEAFALLKQKEGSAKIPPELPYIFQRMTGAFDEVDLMVIDKEMENLNALNLGGALKEEIEWIKDMVMMMDYDGAVERMNKLTNGA